MMRCTAKSSKATYRLGEEFGKPNVVDVKSHTKLSNLINEDSCFFFKALKLDSQTDFLAKDVTEWDDNPYFIACHNVVRMLKVVNDAAERGVKLGYDYLPLAKGEERYQNVLQTVECSYKQCPDLRRKTKHNNSKWCLHF